MKKLIKEKWSKMQEMSENMKRDHISESAAQCSYYTILSFMIILRNSELLIATPRLHIF